MARKIAALLVLCLAGALSQEITLNNVEFDPFVPDEIREDARLTTIELVHKYGYPGETHTITTRDGYMLQLHRIPGSSKSPPAPGKPPIFLMHGILSSSGDWVNSGPQTAFAYLLADEGYDVWMGNARGNRYGRRHLTLNPNRSAFWKFSWHEIGVIDVPTMIDFVLNFTGFENLHYIGHSQGTTVFWVMASELPEYNRKIKSMQALAPVAFMSNVRSPFIRAAVLFLNSLELATKLLGINEFLPNSELMTIGGEALCNEEALTSIVCTNVLFLIAGYNSEQLNTTMLPVFMGHAPAGASSRQLIHYGQLVRSELFRKYDHGLLANLLEYGSFSPPRYQLNKITAPVALHYSDNDWIADPKDVEELHRNLGNSAIGKFRVPLASFNHLDYVWAIDARGLLYNRVISIMRKFE